MTIFETHKAIAQKELVTYRFPAHYSMASEGFLLEQEPELADMAEPVAPWNLMISDGSFLQKLFYMKKDDEPGAVRMIQFDVLFNELGKVTYARATDLANGMKIGQPGTVPGSN